MPRLEACLVDAYDTIVTCDFSIIQDELSALSGISPGTWQVEYARIGALVSDGRISKAEAFARLLRPVGREARPAWWPSWYARTRSSCLRTRACTMTRSRSCSGSGSRHQDRDRQQLRGEHPPLLVKHGVDALADTLVLSCEVRSAKPAAEIFRCALDRLGVAAEAAVFVDDQPGYCAGSVAAGIRAVQIVRLDVSLDGQVPAPGTTVVRSLPEVEALFGE